MMGKDRIESVIRSLREEVFHRVSLYLKDRRKVRVDAGKRGSESTFVHFRQLFQEGGTDLPSLHITGKNGHTARVREMREGEAHFQFFPVYGAIWRKARFSRIKKRPLSSTDEEKARLSVGAHPPPLI